MFHSIQCRCGALRGQLHHPERAIRGVCYCRDCRAYAQHLGVASQTHDELGGADFVATQARYLRLTEGTEHLACLSLSEHGLLRWYARCCQTPLGNTARNWKLPYVGLTRVCLDAEPNSYERSFGAVKMRVNTASATQAPPAMALQTFATLARLIPQIMAGSLSGAYRSTPFFSSEGVPVTRVQVVSKAERERAYAAA